MFPKKFNNNNIIPPVNPEQIEENIRYKFQNKDLLVQALIHRSFLNENPGIKESNERLEFLGDAILEFIVSEHLFKSFSTQAEGHLTAMRSKLVNTTALGGVAEKLNLGQALFMSRGEEKSGGRTSRALLANTTEAIIGAIYMDQGVGAANAFIHDHILINLEEIVKHSLKDPKSLFQEYIQAAGLPAPVYKTISETGPDHSKEFIIEVWVDKAPYAKGNGSSKQLAAQSAAEEALKVWSETTHA